MLFLNHGRDSLKCCLEKDSKVTNGIIEKDEIIHADFKSSTCAFSWFFLLSPYWGDGGGVWYRCFSTLWHFCQQQAWLRQDYTQKWHMAAVAWGAELETLTCRHFQSTPISFLLVCFWTCRQRTEQGCALRAGSFWTAQAAAPGQGQPRTVWRIVEECDL